MDGDVTCVVCGSDVPTPVGAFCSDACREATARKHQAWRDEYLANPGNIRPGDRVRLKTPAEKARA